MGKLRVQISDVTLGLYELLASQELLQAEVVPWLRSQLMLNDIVLLQVQIGHVLISSMNHTAAGAQSLAGSFEEDVPAPTQLAAAVATSETMVSAPHLTAAVATSWAVVLVALLCVCLLCCRRRTRICKIAVAAE